MSVQKINCPFHQDDTPSLAIYPTHYVCYGCGARGSHAELEKEHPIPKGQPFTRSKVIYKAEDLAASIAKIKALPTKRIRGHQLPYDNQGYYLVYPGNGYYLKRLFDAPKGVSKYRYPYGQRNRLYWAQKTDSKTLYVVEGQFNALSLSLLVPNADIVSPGSCTELIRPEYVKTYLQYKTVHVIVDKDAAGVVAGIQLKETLTKAGILATLTALEKDINRIHEEAFNDTEFRKTIQALIPKA